jgi:hypothetical protein
MARLTSTKLHEYDLANGSSYFREIEMTVDGMANDAGIIIQFWDDVDVYGFREAIMLLRNYIGDHENLKKLEALEAKISKGNQNRR